MGDALRTPVVLQSGAADCAAACLTMVLGMYGAHVPADEVRRALGPGRDGASAQALAIAARAFGLDVRSILVSDPQELGSLPSGAVLHWNLDHFVVLERYSPRWTSVLDPACGRRRVGAEELSRKLTGVVLLFSPNALFHRRKPDHSRVLRLLRLGIGPAAPWIKIVVGSLLLQILALSSPWLLGCLVDAVLPAKDARGLSVVGAALAAVVATHALVGFVRETQLTHLKASLDERLAEHLISHIVSLPLPAFADRAAGDLLQRINGTATLREILAQGLLSALFDAALVSATALLLALSSPPLAGVALLLALAQVAALLLPWRRQSELISEGIDASAKLQSYQIEMLRGMESLKSQGLEQGALLAWQRRFWQSLSASVRRGRHRAPYDALLSSLRLSAPLLLTWLGGALVLSGEIPLGAMLAASTLGLSCLEPVDRLLGLGGQAQLFGSWYGRIDDLLREPAERSGGDKLIPLQGSFALRRVSFRYDSRAPLVLREIDLSISRGELVAIVGASGSGKSTLARLLLGLLPATEGDVSVDERPLGELDLRDLRSQIGVVTQRSDLFSGTLASNVSFGRSDLPREEIERALRRACLGPDLDRMPLGIDTPVGEGGAMLSGGQRQRLAIARALARSPRAVLLDEATSALDALTERKIFEEIGAMAITRIVVAHRLSTVAAADRILVLDQGQIVEQGRHAELLERSGAYASLVRAQMPSEAP